VGGKGTGEGSEITWHVITEITEERCACLGLDRLELRRLQCDLITCFKIIHGFNCLRSEEFFTPCDDQIARGHPFKLRVQHCRIDARKVFL